MLVGATNGFTKYMLKPLYCTTRICRTENNGVHDIHWGPHKTFKRHCCVASIYTSRSINVSHEDKTSSCWNLCKDYIPSVRSSMNLGFGSAMRDQLNVIHIYIQYSLQSVRNRCAWPANSQGSNCANGLVWFHTYSTTWSAASWLAKPIAIPVNLQGVAALGRPCCSVLDVGKFYSLFHFNTSLLIAEYCVR
jgi:hypothetical protein